VAFAASRPPFGVGSTLGDKFEIFGVLGEGGTGIVYDARRLAEDDRVALKVIHQHLAGDAQIRGRFAREAAILRRLEGRHLCRMLDSGEVADPRRESAGLLYMAMARIDGPALEALLKNEGPLDIGRAVPLFLDVCEALREAHSQGVIHRDLKPANVLLRGGERAVVVDFGMAKIVTGGGTGTTALTQHNMVFGTPEYMAPEQARGDELDARCDVYAAGIILYELLTGGVPFRGTTPLSVLTAHLTAQPQTPRERAPDRGISPALEAVVLHAIAKDPMDRYATASALAAAVLAAVGGPDDIASVRPASRALVAVDTGDAHAATTPGPSPLSPVLSAALSAPPRAARSRGAGTRAARDRPSATWIAVCVAAALAGIALGAWLSVHASR
jgi:eukaryotic-like serine/threonine-protein kinase